jgi:hypothetical protein
MSGPLGLSAGGCYEPGTILVHWKKVAYGAFFGTPASFPAAKSVVFAACPDA